MVNELSGISIKTPISAGVAFLQHMDMGTIMGVILIAYGGE
jgi:hypothetical protein